MDTNLLSLIVFGGVASASGATMFALKNLLQGSPQEDSNATVSLRRTRRTQHNADDSIVTRFDNWFERTLAMSGLEISLGTATLLLLLAGLVIGGTIFTVTLDAVAAFVGVLFGFVLVVVSVMFAKRRRLKKFEENFPAALDLLARAVRAGESLDQAIELVAKSSPEPVASELRRCANQLEMGLSVPAAMQAFHQRVELMDVRIFASTLSVHRETGGNLAITVERLADVIRNRMEYHRQLRSVTSAGRFSVYLISSLGPILFAYLFLVQPEYGHGLWEDQIGRVMLIIAVVSQLLGILWVSRILKTDY